LTSEKRDGAVKAGKQSRAEAEAEAEQKAETQTKGKRETEGIYGDLTWLRSRGDEMKEEAPARRKIAGRNAGSHPRDSGEIRVT
jgi:hypothetical protein